MKKILLVFVFMVSSLAFSQEEDAWVYFTDKPNAQFYFDNPLQMLSQRALDRRANQSIVLSINDVPISQEYINQVATTPGITVKAKSKWMNCIHVRGSQQAISALTSLSFVQSVKFADNSLNTSGRASTTKSFIPVNKTMDVTENFNYGNSANQIEMLNGHLLHQANYTGQGKIIAVLDSGFIKVDDVAPFDRLFTNELLLGGYNYVSQNDSIYDLHNHGTLTLSCMGGFVDGELVGTAPDAKYYLFVTEDVTEENPVEESYWVEAAEEADRLGADIISSSLGYYGYDNPAYSHVYSNMTGDEAFASKGANIAFSKGMIIVASAGNSGSSPEPFNHISVPAEATNVLAIGAVKFDETYATFSSVGPGYQNRLKPDLMAKGQAATVANTSGDVQTASGTSFSCPIMAGMIASFWSAFPSLSNQQIVSLVRQSADRYFDPIPNYQYGHGIPDFQLAVQLATLSTQQNQMEVFNFFPNPTNNNITFVSATSDLGGDIAFYNSLGQLVFSHKIQNVVQTLSLETLSAGVYFFTFSTPEKIHQGKIIKN
jgi:serine protease AprX